MTHSGINNSLPALILVSLCLLLPMPLLASASDIPGHQPDCLKIYRAIAKRHSKAKATLIPGAHAYFKTLHGLEDQIFHAFAQCPKDARLFSLMGEVQISLGNLQLASLYAQRAHNWNPDIWQTHHLMGTTLILQEKLDQALPFLQQAADLAEERAELRFNLCQAYVNAERYQSAITACTRLLELENHDLKGAGYHLRARAHHALDKNSLATQDFDNARQHGYTE